MTDTREKVLKTLLSRPRCTINELADEVGIHPISIRHHIANLQAEGLIDSAEERHGVGRPRYVYFLTETGVEQFPTRYVRLTIRLLKQLKDSLPPSLVDNLFVQMAQDLANDLSVDAKVSSLSIEERLNFIKQILRREGFDIEWERDVDEIIINEASCPYYHVGLDHPEVCSVDQVLISTVLSKPASKTRCILNGDLQCTYVISYPAITERSHE